MLKPSIAELVESMNTRYQLVNAVAKRARKIAEYAEREEIVLPEKPIRIAISEIADGSLRIVPFEDE